MLVYVPRFHRSGDVPPQLILTGSHGNTPAVALVFSAEKSTANTIVYDGRLLPRLHPQTNIRSILTSKPRTNHTYSINGRLPVHLATPALANWCAPGGDWPGHKQHGWHNNPLLTLLPGSWGVSNSHKDLTANIQHSEESNGMDMIFHLGNPTQYRLLKYTHWKNTFRFSCTTTAWISDRLLPGNRNYMSAALGFLKRYCHRTARVKMPA